MLSVTTILRHAGVCGSMEFVPESALMRGRAVHAAINLDERGKLSESSVHAEVAPRLASWRAWRKAAGLVYERGEFEVRGPGYIGHPDIVGMIDGRRWLLDVKGGNPAPWHRLQTALYALALDESGVRRGAVYVTDDGSIARLEDHRDRADFNAAVACVSVCLWREKNGPALA